MPPVSPAGAVAPSASATRTAHASMLRWIPSPSSQWKPIRPASTAVYTDSSLTPSSRASSKPCPETMSPP